MVKQNSLLQCQCLGDGEAALGNTAGVNAVTALCRMVCIQMNVSKLCRQRLAVCLVCVCGFTCCGPRLCFTNEGETVVT